MNTGKARLWRIAALAALGLFLALKGCGTSGSRGPLEPSMSSRVANFAPILPVPHPSLSLDFEGGFLADGLDGAVHPRVSGAPTIVPGRFGGAMLSGPRTGYLEFPNDSIVSSEEGTVEMWVSPVDWCGGDHEFHVFFESKGTGALYLYKFHDDGLLLLTCENSSGPYRNARRTIADWKPGDWHHVAATWSLFHQKLYVDGSLVASVKPDLPKRLGGWFRVGDHPWDLPRDSSSLIDRVRIYDRALGAEYIAAHYRGQYDFAVAGAQPRFRLEWRFDSEHATVILSARCLDDILLSGVEALFSVDGAPGPRSAFSGSLASIRVDAKSMSTGRHTVAVQLVRGAHVLGRETQAIVVPDSSWSGATAAASIPAPWTAVEAASKGQGLLVRVWGREYEFNRSGLPTQIRVDGHDLLLFPIDFVATIAGKRLDSKGEVRLVASTPDAVDIESRTKTEAGSSLVIRSKLEYDGLLMVELDLRVPAEDTITEASLSVPLSGDAATLRHLWSAGWAGDSGALPAGQGVLIHRSFLPFAWLGNDHRGLFWFCETGEHWLNWRSDDAFQITRDRQEVRLRLRLVTPESPARGGINFRFGLQATPVKPRSSGWRRRRLAPAHHANAQILWPSSARDSLQYYGYPAAQDREAFRTRVMALQTQGIAAIPYALLTMISEATPEWKWFGEGLAGGPQHYASEDVVAMGAPIHELAPTPGLAAFLGAKCARFVEEYGLDGLYFDNTQPYPCWSETGACGWTDEHGARQPTYPMLAWRSVYRTVYTEVKRANPSALLIAHMSGKLAIPILAYVDAYVDGEQFSGQVERSRRRLGLDTLRAEFMGHQWGLAPVYLAAGGLDAEATRELVGRLLLHDICPWPSALDAKQYDEAFESLDAFGWAEADFLPYFGDLPPATTTMKDVLISGFRRHDGQSLLVVVNVSSEDRSGEVRPGPLGPTFTLSVPAKSYRLVVVGGAD